MVEMEAQHSLGAAIRARRRELGWSQEDLARRIADRGDEAFRQSDVSRLELGKVALPRRERLEHIAAILGLSLGHLLARSGWTGAASAFAAEPPSNSLVTAVRLDRAPAAAFSFPEWRAGESAAVSQNLRQLIEQARETRARTREVLRQCEATSALYEQVRRGVSEESDLNGLHASDRRQLRQGVLS